MCAWQVQGSERLKHLCSVPGKFSERDLVRQSDAAIVKAVWAWRDSVHPNPL